MIIQILDQCTFRAVTFLNIALFVPFVICTLPKVQIKLLVLELITRDSKHYWLSLITLTILIDENDLFRCRDLFHLFHHGINTVETSKFGTFLQRKKISVMILNQWSLAHCDLTSTSNHFRQHCWHWNITGPYTVVLHSSSYGGVGCVQLN